LYDWKVYPGAVGYAPKRLLHELFAVGSLSSFSNQICNVLCMPLKPLLPDELHQTLQEFLTSVSPSINCPPALARLSTNCGATAWVSHSTARNRLPLLPFSTKAKRVCWYAPQTKVPETPAITAKEQFCWAGLIWSRLRNRDRLH